MAGWSNINVKGDSAKVWSRELEELNEKTDALLQEIAVTLQSIESSGTGQLIESLVQVANGCVIAFEGLMEVGHQLAEKFISIIQKFGEVTANSTQEVDAVATRSFSGGGKSINSTNKINVYSR